MSLDRKPGLSEEDRDLLEDRDPGPNWGCILALTINTITIGGAIYIAITMYPR